MGDAGKTKKSWQLLTRRDVKIRSEKRKWKKDLDGCKKGVSLCHKK